MLRRLESITYTLFLFLTPLLVTFFSKELFEFPKTNFLYFITGSLILVSSWNFQFRINFLKQNRTTNLMFLSLGLILLSNILSFAFSIDRYTSLFGYYTRFNGGLISILCILIWIIFLSNRPLTKQNIRSSVWIIFISGLLITLYAIFQKSGIDNDIWLDNSANRVFSTLGQPNWLAAYLIPIFYLSIYFLKNSAWPIYLKMLPVGIIYSAILFTQSLSGIFAFAVTLLVFVFLNKSQTYSLLKRYWHLGLIAVALTFLFAIPYKNRIQEQLKNMTGIIQLLKTDDSQSLEPNYGDTGKIRLILWDGTMNLITSRPKQFLIGSGPETFAYAFPKFRPDSINATSESNFVHNKPHNWYLEIFSNLGLLGFISYLTFISVTIYLFIKTKKDHLLKTLFCGWLSILITNFFGWPTVPLSILFFILPVFMHYKYFKLNEFKETEDKFWFVKAFAVFMLANFLILSSVIFTLADYNFKSAKYDRATLLNPFEPRYELFKLVYSREINMGEIKTFYYRNRHNPYVVKTLVNYLNQVSTSSPQENFKIKNLREGIIKDAKENSPNDLQFRED